MYLRVKKDSVTSILMFIFNVFLVERGIHSVPLRKIFKLLEPFQKSETSIRMGLSRGVQNGLFVNEKQGQDVFYRVTGKAIQSFEYWNKTLSSFQEKIKLQHADWDRTWSVVLLNMTARGNSVADFEQMADALNKLGYGSISKGQWLSPYDFSADVEKLAFQYGIKKEIFIFSGCVQNKKPETIALEVWQVKELGFRYKKHLQRLQVAARELNNLPNTGQILPFLYLYGSELFEIIQDDPQLPLALLPADWAAFEAVRVFRDKREQLLPKANSFIDANLEN